MNDLIFDPQNLTKDTIKKYLCPSATDQELTFGLQIAKTFNLNPLKREVYFVKYGNSPMSILTGYEVYLKRAERSKKWNGMEVTTSGSVKDGNLVAIVKIYKKNWDYPINHEVYYSEYVQNKADGSPNKFWATKPITMIKKVAVSQALRLAFPDEFDGMPYTSDEVVDQEKIVDITTLNNKEEQHTISNIEDQLVNDNHLVIKEHVKVNTDDLEEIALRVFKKKRSDMVSWLKDKFHVESLDELKEYSRELCKNMLIDFELWQIEGNKIKELENKKQMENKNETL